jgi:ATP-dependent RNA helicase DHX29
LASGTTTPRTESDTRHIGSTVSGPENTLQVSKKLSPVKKITSLDYESDIDPDDLLPVYLESKKKLFRLQPSNGETGSKRPNGRNTALRSLRTRPTPDLESAKLLRKIKQIEDDVLFDKYIADQQWEIQRIQLEREAAARRNVIELTQTNNDSEESESLLDSDDEVSREAARIGVALLEENGSDDDAALADLFASLPVNEVDPLTGKSSTVINGSNGIKVTIQDFGKWTGVNPTRVLEEACRARRVL